jgi:hypothetical protein
MSFLYESEQEIEQVVRGFETCATPAADFHHREHLTVAVWYLQTLTPRDAVARMRAALLRFLDHHGVASGKYSEDVTVFWVDTVARHLEKEIGAQASLLEKCNQVIGAFVSPKDPTARSQKAPDARSTGSTSEVSSTAHKPASRVEVEESLVKS